MDTTRTPSPSRGDEDHARPSLIQPMPFPIVALCMTPDTLTRATRALVVFLALTGGALSAQTRPTASALTVQDILSVREFADRVQVDLSPDGKFVAFAIQDPTRAAEGGGAAYFSATGVPRGHRGTDILVAELLTSKTVSVTGARGSNWAPAWSPDGRTLAFLSDRDGAVRVWLWDRQSKVLRRLALDPVRVFFGFEGIRWSPGGRRVAVKLAPESMTRAQLDRLLPTAANAAAQRSAVGSGVTAIVYDATSGVVTVPDTGAVTPQTINLESTRSFLNVELGDLATIDTRTGRVKRLAPHVRAIAWRWSPDGARLAFTTRQPDGGRGVLVYDNYDLFVVDTTGKQLPRLVAPRMIQEYGLNFSWSPNGRQLAFQSDTALYVIHRDSGDARRVAIDGAVRESYRAPLWLNDDMLLARMGDTLWRLPVDAASGPPAVVAALGDRHLIGVVAPADAQRIATRSVAVAVSDPATKQYGFRMYDLATGTMTGSLEEEAKIDVVSPPFGFDVSTDGKTMSYVAERADRPADVVVTQDQLTHSNRVTNLNPQITRLALGGTKLIQWSGTQGEILRGALLMPANYEPGRRFPLIVKVYGGDRKSAQLNQFGLEPGIDNLQLLATRGYAVLLPDTPLRVGTPMNDIAATLLPGVDSVIAMGIADPTRLGIMGFSYGGYSVLAVLVQTNRFKAAVSGGGFSNLVSQYGEMREDGSAIGVEWSEKGQGRMGGHPWELRERYIDNSPYFFLDRVRTPVLLLHGAADRTVRVQRAEETYVGLRRLGREVQLVEYAGEEHHPGSWSIANATDYWRRVFEWFERWMPR